MFTPPAVLPRVHTHTHTCVSEDSNDFFQWTSCTVFLLVFGKNQYKGSTDLVKSLKKDNLFSVKLIETFSNNT